MKLEGPSPSNAASFFYVRNAAWDESYHPLPSLCLGFLVIWCFSAFSWALHTWRNRHYQINNLQCIMATVPLIKALQLGLSFSFWYSCINLQICSLWMSFGVYVTGVLFQTATFMSFMLISHGYCIMYERLSVLERRMTAALCCGLYLTLVGYQAAIPCFTVFTMINYSLSFYLIFRHISKNLLVLREQLNLIEDEDAQSMYSALHVKYDMFKKFQGTMQIVAVVEFLIHMNVDNTPEKYWCRLFLRECTQLCIFIYIGWTFRARGASPYFTIIPTLKSKWEITVPPVYKIEMDATDFSNLTTRDLQVGVPTCHSAQFRCSTPPVLLLVQNPHSATKCSSDKLLKSTISACYTSTTASLYNGHQV
ncbi:hypothetical protein AXF42_Ash007461 [Apostasia shenzhenica]|uniref:Uncharacterized protein n=1 Tax=Apostasia shenzhenica TaxID=1088818 RepID=A0A2I0BA95_9ASPA|nr:hypothetical protein AXF42_Ash007461 [Apostasia shenzhenica]